MSELFLVSVYFLLGACWVNIIDEFVFTDMTGLHKLASFLFWPGDILMGGMTR